MKTALGFLAILAILYTCASTALNLPGPVTLELYDVQDMVYMMDRHLEVDLTSDSSSTVPNTVEYWTQLDLADETRLLVPGARSGDRGRSVEAQNGLLIVRATTIQHLAVRIRLDFARAWIRFLEG